ncbi:MAG: glycosyltransferase family 4 protein [Gemmataceae bacterium]|nr:glycosyltransferase family 4 protein [Gemmataceae bacterium]
MQLTAIVEGFDHVCCRYRVRPLEPLVAAHGGVLRYETKAPGIFSGPPSSDAVLVQRRLLSGWSRRWLRRGARHLIFDFDDAVWLRDSYSPRGLVSGRRLRRFRSIIEEADLIVAGNRFLADQAARFTDPALVSLIPTCLDPNRYRIAHHQAECRAPRLAWIGSSSTLQGLERIADRLDSIGRACPGATLVLICDRPIRLSSLRVEFHTWSEENEGDVLATADIGISWLPDDDWSRGKCGLKLLQYMAAGLPVLANPVGVQQEIVQHGTTGYHCDSTDDWIEAVRALAGDPHLRQSMGKAGRREVEQHFSLTAMRTAWRHLFQRLGAISVPSAA